jgi:hypothetical protein
MEPVRLYSAYYWNCPTCDEINFAKGAIHEFSDEDKDYLNEEFGEPEKGWVTGEYITRPDEVVCQHCHHVFEALDPTEDIDDEDEDEEDDE